MNYLSHDFLQQLPLFSNVNHTTLDKLIEKAHIQHFESNATIFFDKEQLPCLLVVLKGTTSLYKTHTNGQTKTIFMLGKGDVLNETLRLETPSAINCRAYDNCSILYIYKCDFCNLMQTDFALTENIMDAFSKRISRLYRQLKNSTSVIKIEKKLAAKIWKLAHDYGSPCVDGICIDFPITITALADFLGSYRETISRALKLLVEKKLVIYRQKTIIVPDLDSLAHFFKT